MFLSSDLSFDFGGALSAALGKAKSAVSSLTEKMGDLLPLAQQATDVYATVKSISSGSSSPARASTAVAPQQYRLTNGELKLSSGTPTYAAAPSLLSTPLVLMVGGGIIFFLMMRRKRRGRR